MSASTQPSSNTGTELDQLCVNTIRTLSLDAVQKAESGHPGLPLGMAPSAYVLWTKFLRHNPHNPRWQNRDRFLLSAGHGSMLIYSLLHLTGYDLPLEEIKRFRQFGSKTPGHPENVLTPGVEITTGPLGQGFANGVGLAMGAAHLAAKFNKDGFPIIDHFIYAIVSDGDLMEGVASEAASLAGHLKLGKLIYLYDDNHVTIEGFTSLAFSENVPQRFEAYGWHTLTVPDGNDLASIEEAIRTAQNVTDRPSLISVKTTIGFGMPTAGTRKAHSDAPGADAVRATKRALGWDEDKEFFIPDAALAHFREAVERGTTQEQEWDALVERYVSANETEGRAWQTLMKGDLPEGWEEKLPTFEGAKPMATRAASGEVINALAPVIPALVGGSADLGPSNNTDIKDGGSFEAGSYGGRIFHWGIREHAMSATMTGMRAHPLRRHVHVLRRLHEARHPPRVSFGSAGHLRLHARLGRTRRRRTHASTNRTARDAARRPAPEGHTPGRPGGSQPGVVRRDSEATRADRARPHATESADARPQSLLFGGGFTARRVHARRGD
jgi:transketolase